MANNPSNYKVGELYMVPVYDVILDSQAGHGHEGYYFGESCSE